MKSRTIRFVTGSVLTVALMAVSAADKSKSNVDVSKLPPASSKAGVTYAGDIKPLFEKIGCFKCHGPEKQKGKLRVDSLEATMKGSENGPILIAGKSAQSVIVHNVARIGDPDDAMPPEGKADPLTKDQIGLIRAWIDQGAK